MKKFWPLLLAGIFLLVGLLTLKDYGINWDEPAHFMRGQAYLHYFLTGKKNYDNLPKLKIHYPKNDRYVLKDKIDFEDDRQFRRSLYQSDHWNGEWFFQNDTPHPPLNDILAALSNFIFYQKLGVLPDVEAYHFFEILAAAILVFLVVWWAKETHGNWAGLVAGVSLALSPLFWAESHYNIKDPIEACFFGLTIYGFWKAVKRDSFGWMMASSIFFGLALGTKLNIIFVVLIILPWLLFSKKKLSRKILSSLLIYPLIAFLIFFISWPYLWPKPLQGLIEVWQYYRGIGVSSGGGFNFYPFEAIIFTTPLVILFLFLVGFIFAKDNVSFLWQLWFLVPILRVILPGTVIYGGLRQIMEFLPAMALLTGLGAEKLRKINFRFLIIIFFFFGLLVIKLFQLHPNEGFYFNFLIGGLKGASEKNFPNWGLSLGNEYRQGIEWFNKNAPQDSNLTLARGLLSNIPRIWIRPDINFGDYYFSGQEKKGEYIMALTHQGWEDWIPEQATYLKKLKPLYELKVEEVTVLAIWKNGEEMLK